MIQPAEQLRVQSLSRRYETDGPWVLKDATFSACAGETLAIVGPSGSGKSTLLNVIGSLDKPTSGTVWLGATQVTALTDGTALAAYRASQVGFVFQDHHLLGQLTAIENVLLPALAANKSENRSRAGELLNLVGLLDRAVAFPSQLSGGERQRVAIARAMMNNPAVLLCDEPTGNLDHQTGCRVVEMLLELARRQNTIVLMVTHNLELAGRFGRILELKEGKLEAALRSGV